MFGCREIVDIVFSSRAFRDLNIFSLRAALLFSWYLSCGFSCFDIVLF